MKAALFDIRWAIALLCIVGGLWVLYPSRQLLNRSQSNDVVDIVYSGMGGALTRPMQDVVEAFERQSDQLHAKDPSLPRYRVIAGQNAANARIADPTRFMISLAGGRPPDVVLFDRFAVSEWAARGAFDPLDRFVADDQAAHVAKPITADQFYAPCWEEAHYQGHLYGIPATADARALYYNRDLFIRAGIVDKHGQPQPPRTWDELRADAKRLTERNGAGQITTLGFSPNFGNSWLYMYGFMNDATFLSKDGRTCLLDSTPVEQALDFMQQVYDDAGGYEAVQAFEAGFHKDTQDAFICGAIAMKIDGPEAIRDLAQFGRDTDFAVAPPPRPADKLGEGPTSWMGGYAWAIPAAANNKQAAWAFIRFATSDEAYHLQMASDHEATQAEGRIYIPQVYPEPSINQYAFDHYVVGNPDVPRRFQAAVSVFDALLPHARYRPVTPVGQLLWDQQIRAMETALYHRVSPHVALADASATVQQALNQVYEPPRGTAILSWKLFYVGYACLVIAVVVGAFYWDTSSHFRHGIARFVGLSAAGAEVIPGARGSIFRRQWSGGFISASPWIFGFLIFGAGPMLFSLVISFCDYDALHPARFIGLQNFREVLFQDRLVPLALGNTIYMVMAVPLAMAVTLAAALLLNQRVRGLGIWRTLFYLPAVVPIVASCVLWVWILAPDGGLLNNALHLVGVQGPLWLQSPQWSKPALILMTVWGAGGNMIIWLAGLQGIPASLYEAASIDGASRWSQFLNVTLPQLTPYIFFNMLMGIIATFQTFTQAFIMTAGGPEDSTLFYVYHLFNNAFRYGRMGYASAMAWVLFAIVLGLTAVQLSLSKRWVHYGDQA